MTSSPPDRLNAAFDHIALASPDPEALARFYQRALGLAVARHGADWVGEAAGRRVHVVAGPPKTLAYAAYRVASPELLAQLRGRLAAAGRTVEASPSPWFPDGFAVRDPDGNRLVFGTGPAATGPGEGPAAGFTARLQHLVLASRSADRLAAFYEQVLGFCLSDSVVDETGVARTFFLRSDHEHHSFAVFQADADRLDHHCYEAGEWGLIRDWGDRFAAERIPVQWGPGRHGPGDNLFLFVHDLDGNWVEISAELEVVSADRTPGVWPHEERTLNTWGAAPLRS